MANPAIDPRQKSGPKEATHPITGVPWEKERSRQDKLDNRLDRRAIAQGWLLVSEGRSDYYEAVTIQDAERTLEFFFWKKSHGFSHGTYFGGPDHVVKLKSLEQAERAVAGAKCSCTGSIGPFGSTVVEDPKCGVHA